MRTKQRITVYPFIVLIFAICLLVIIRLITDNQQPTSYRWLYILPTFYMVATCLLFLLNKKTVFGNIGAILVIAQLGVRNVVTPYIMSIGNYTSIFSEQVHPYINCAIFLMTYEMLCCYLVIYFKTIRLSGHQQQTHRSMAKAISNRALRRMLIFLLTLCIGVWIVFPIVRGNYRTIFETVTSGVKDSLYSHSDYASVGSIARSFSTLFSVVMSFLRLALPAYIIVKLYNRKNSTLNLILSILLITTQFLLIPIANAAALIPAVILMLLLLYLYEKQRKIILIMSAITTVTFTVVIFSLNYSKSLMWYGYRNIWQYISSWLNSYLTGVNNVANIYLMPQDNKLAIFSQTLIGAIPFRSTILPSTIGWETIDTLFTSLPRSGGQIVSTIGSGQFFFTEVFSPVFSCIFVNGSVSFGNKYRNTMNNWKRITYLYLSVILALGVGMYNLPITLNNCIQTGVPLLLIAKLAGKDTLNISNNKPSIDC